MSAWIRFWTWLWRERTVSAADIVDVPDDLSVLLDDLIRKYNHLALRLQRLQARRKRELEEWHHRHKQCEEQTQKLRAELTNLSERLRALEDRS